jgi:hypothetical protein
MFVVLHWLFCFCAVFAHIGAILRSKHEGEPGTGHDPWFAVHSGSARMLPTRNMTEHWNNNDPRGRCDSGFVLNRHALSCAAGDEFVRRERWSALGLKASSL